MLKRILVPAAAVCLLLGLVACDNTGEQQRSVVTVSSVNGGNPVLCDVADGSGAALETWVPVQFYNRPYNDLVTTGPADPHGTFVITHYHIDWTTPGGSTTMPARDETTSFAVLTGSIATMQIRVASLDEVLGPTLSPLVGGGNVTMVAHVTFTGHEAGTERETEVEAVFTVSFANYIDS